MTTPAPDTAPTRRASSGAVVLAAVIDVILVLAFVLVGRGSHGENVLGGALVTFWPFAVGLVIGWLAARVWRRPFAVWPSGVVAWLGTLVVGMLLRVVVGQGIALPFVIVAAVVLAVFLLGWRVVALLVLRGRGKSATAGAASSSGEPSARRRG